MTYRPPVADMLATLKQASGLDETLYGDLTLADVEAILEEGAKFAADRIAPSTPSATATAPPSRTAK